MCNTRDIYMNKKKEKLSRDLSRFPPPTHRAHTHTLSTIIAEGSFVSCGGKICILHLLYRASRQEMGGETYITSVPFFIASLYHWIMPENVKITIV